MKSYVFPGQGAQFPGMGKALYDSDSRAKKMFGKANEILGFDISKIMFEGTADELKATKVTQPAVFLHSVILSSCIPDFRPDMAAGHSLGEFSALTVSGALSFEEALKLVSVRATAMQKCCEANPGTMAAIIGLPDETVEKICAEINANGGTVVAANYNCNGQVVVSGSIESVRKACDMLTAAGARRAIQLQVGGAFHSPLMEPARKELAEAIEKAKFNVPRCPVYQNVDAKPHTDPSEIRQNLLLQLTHPVRWAESVRNMVADGASTFVEVGPGKVLQGLIRKTAEGVQVEGLQ
ncbi:MAG: ACP S-malonyltransferase [Bacteroidales bacterium]|nr:ACP S-malonyltransferase [Bacteroidales bacterium]MCI2122258.1 ACP S-malonyltransferase [Bacteroidales bacterium]MCI2145609.1 ACP S-malonyltransferase [Bacteroidales bacterium]